MIKIQVQYIHMKMTNSQESFHVINIDGRLWRPLQCAILARSPRLAYAIRDIAKIGTALDRFNLGKFNDHHHFARLHYAIFNRNDIYTSTYTFGARYVCLKYFQTQKYPRLSTLHILLHLSTINFWQSFHLSSAHQV